MADFSSERGLAGLGESLRLELAVAVKLQTAPDLFICARQLCSFTCIFGFRFKNNEISMFMFNLRFEGNLFELIILSVPVYTTSCNKKRIKAT